MTAVVVLAVAAGLLGWLLTRGGGNHKAGGTTYTAGEVLPGIPVGVQVGPIALTVQGLESTQMALHQAIYWLGPKAGYRYGLERTGSNNAYVTYLPAGALASSDRSKYVVIGSYPLRNPEAALRKVADQEGNDIINLPGGGIAVPGKVHPYSVYVAYPTVDTEIEVYSPHPGDARKLAVSKALRPVG